MINLFKIILILFISNSVLAATSLKVRLKTSEISTYEINYIEFVLSTDKPIYGLQVDGEISKYWLKNVNTAGSLYVTLLDGEFFEKNKYSTITQFADKKTGTFSYITSLVRPANAVENNAVIFSMPVTPVSDVLANLSLNNVKIGYQDGSTEIINDIEIDSLSISKVVNESNVTLMFIFITFMAISVIFTFGFKRRKIAAF
jgi:hypothetical protein